MKTIWTLFVLGLLTATQVRAGCLSPEDNYGSPTPCGGNPQAQGNPYYTPLDVHRNVGADSAIDTKIDTKKDEKIDEEASQKQDSLRVNPRVNQQLDQRR